MPAFNEKDVLSAIHQQEEVNQRKIEEKRCDETGAQKEALFHSELFKTIKEQIDFSPEGKAVLKPGAEDVVFLMVCSRDLKRANKEGGHFGGDNLLAETVRQTGSLLHASGIDNYDIYHIRSSDFIVKARTEDKNVESFYSSADNRPIEFAKGTKPGKITAAGISLQEIVDFYNSCVDINEIPTDKSLALNRKSFTGTAIQLMIFKQEHQKLLDIYSDFMQDRSTNPNIEESFALYGATNFRAQGISTFDELQKVPDVGDLLFKLAYSRAYEGGELPLHIWQAMESGIKRYSGKALKYGENNLQKNRELEQQALDKDNIEREQQIKKAFSLERAIYTSGLGIALMSVSKYLNGLPENFETASQVSIAQMEMLGASVESLHSIMSTDPIELERWEKIREGITEAFIPFFERTRIQNPIVNAEYVFPLQRINQTLQTVRTTVDRLKLERDFLTGLENKEIFENDLYELLSKDDTNVGLISLDMGFLQYFNNIGERQLGDLAISKAGYILEKVVDDLAREGIKAKAYRVGGDEFSLIIEGDASQTEKAFALIYEKCLEENELTESPTALIPRSPNSKDTYVPRMLQFDGNPLHSEEGKQVLKQIIEMEEGLNPFSENDTQVLNKGLSGEKLPEDEKALYTQVLSEIMVRIGDKIIEENKQQLRFKLMFKLYCDTVAKENSTELQKQQFADLLAFSGKSMNGKNMESFENTIEFAKQEGINLDNLSDVGFMALSQHFYSIGSEVVPRSPLEDLVERFSEKFGKS